jgi:hypothetical protein
VAGATRTAIDRRAHVNLSRVEKTANPIHREQVRALVRGLCHAALLVALVGSLNAFASDENEQDGWTGFQPGNLVVSRSVYDNKASNIAIGTILPPNCTATTGGCAAAGGAPDDGTYPTVWNNNLYDGSFGITSRIHLDELTTNGWLVHSLEVPNRPQNGMGATHDHLVTSFSSKSELALNLSTDRRFLTFMGYVASINAVDVSNSNTPGANDPTNPVGEAVLRAVAQVGRNGRFEFTETNAYSGNNGRAAILNNTDGANAYYMAGNAGNGANPQPESVILGAGAQILTPAASPEAEQSPQNPTPLASFSITLLGAKADKLGKDDNFRGETIFDHVLYSTKGSGSNGVNTLYFVDTTGSACPNGVGLPSPSATLPTQALSYDATTVTTTGLPSNMCILSGFPAVPNKLLPVITSFPFGIWFADASTLYVADEGDGYNGGTDLYTHAAQQTTAGLQKWVFSAALNQWVLAYTLQNGLDLGTPYSVPAYPTGVNTATGLPWAPATDGLRNITGRVDEDGRVTIWAITSTVSGNGDEGADPNRLVVISDARENTDPAVASNERFFTVRTAGFGEVLRGVSFTPGTEAGDR